MSTKTTDIQIKTDNVYCPHCGAIQKKTENFCSHCGLSLHQKPGEKPGEKPSVKKPFYKKKTFMALLVIFVASASVAAVILYMGFSQDGQFKAKVKGIWQEVQKQNDELNKKASEMSKMDDFKEVALKIKTQEEIASDKQDELNKLKTSDTYRDGKEAFLLALSDYKGYLQALRAAADNPSKMTDQDVSEIENLADTSKTSFSKLFTKFDFLDKKLSDDTFNIVAKFQDVRSAYEKQLAFDEQTKAEQDRTAKQEADDKAKVESVVSSFMNAYIAGNQSELNKYMTPAFQKEFNYADLSSDARAYSYPESFRITTIKKNADGQYDIYGRELQVNRESGSKWTINRHFAVIWVQSDSKWYIDRWDIQGE